MRLTKLLLFFIIFVFLVVTIFLVFRSFLETNTKNENDEHIMKNVFNLSNKPTDDLDSSEMLVLSELKQYGKFGLDKDKNEAYDLLMKVIETSEKNGNHYDRGKAFMSLAKLHYESLDASNAVLSYVEALSMGFEEAIIQVGKIYCYGLHPHYLPDKVLAGQIFSKYSYVSDRVRKWSNLYIQDIFEIDYIDLDTIPGNTKYRDLPHGIIEKMDTALHKLRESRVNMVPFTTFFDDSWIRAKHDAGPEPEKEDVALHIPVQTIYNDAQNVHDHVVQNTAKQIIKSLSENTNTQNTFETFGTFETDMQDLIQMVQLCKQTPNFLKTLNSLGNLTHSKYDKSERQIFSLVWNKIKHDTSLVDVFVENIASSVEEGVIVCSTGKIMRMISTLDLIDDELIPTLKPEWAVKGEIGQKIPLLIEESLSSMGKDYAVAYNTYEPSGEQKQKSQAVSDIVKKKLIESCRRDYVDSGVLTEEIMSIYLEDFLEHV